MKFRRQMLHNLYYLRDLPQEIIDELICCFVVKRYAADSVIIKAGDVATHLNFLRVGEIEIFVSSGINMHFEAKENLSDREGHKPRKSNVGVQS